MSESTAPAACTEAEFQMARQAGLLVFSTADEIAIHLFAEAVRAEATASRGVCPTCSLPPILDCAFANCKREFAAASS